MKIIQSSDARNLGIAAGKMVATLIQESLKLKNEVNIILATGTSQFETLDQLLKEKIDWSKINMFHLDEYIGIPITHKASFRKYLKERFINKVGELGSYHFINGENDPAEECKRLNSIISKFPIDVALVGIGENGHLAFNDPPADFENRDPYILVQLDESCRAQQQNEGWFDTFESVPKQAISMSVHQICKSGHIICSVPGKRKARAVKDCLENHVSPDYPASILQEHDSCVIFLDDDSASLLSNKEKLIKIKL